MSPKKLISPIVLITEREVPWGRTWPTSGELPVYIGLMGEIPAWVDVVGRVLTTKGHIVRCAVCESLAKIDEPTAYTLVEGGPYWVEWSLQIFRHPAPLYAEAIADWCFVRKSWSNPLAWDWTTKVATMCGIPRRSVLRMILDRREEREGQE